LIGSILSYCLLVGVLFPVLLEYNPLISRFQVLGSNFFFASYDKEKVDFDKTLTSIMSSLMMLVSISLIIPTMLSIKMKESERGSISDKDMVILSHGIAIVLFILFLVYLFFRLQSHMCLFNYGQYEQYTRRQSVDNTDQEVPDSRLSAWAIGSILITGTVPACVCARYLIDSVDGMAKAANLSKAFVGLILIPAVGNAAKCITIVTASRRRRTIDLAIRTIMSSVLNSLLFMFPFSILLGWVIGTPMYLNFDVFEATIFFLAIIVMTCLMQYGRTNYFEGAMLMGT
jgi:Ca2+:H+ antiporter